MGSISQMSLGSHSSSYPAPPLQSPEPKPAPAAPRITPQTFTPHQARRAQSYVRRVKQQEAAPAVKPAAKQTFRRAERTPEELRAERRAKEEEERVRARQPAEKMLQQVGWGAARCRSHLLCRAADSACCLPGADLNLLPASIRFGMPMMVWPHQCCWWMA